MQTLADVHNHLSVLSPLTKRVQQPRTLWSVARAEGSHDDGLQVRCVDDVPYQVLSDAREEREDDDVVVQSEMGRHGLREVRFQNAVLMIGDVHACIDEVREVERLEGVELLSTLFRRAVAAQQMAAEVDAHLWHQRMAV